MPHYDVQPNFTFQHLTLASVLQDISSMKLVLLITMMATVSLANHPGNIFSFIGNVHKPFQLFLVLNRQPALIWFFPYISSLPLFYDILFWAWYPSIGLILILSSTSWFKVLKGAKGRFDSIIIHNLNYFLLISCIHFNNP